MINPFAAKHDVNGVEYLCGQAICLPVPLPDYCTAPNLLQQKLES